MDKTVFKFGGVYAVCYTGKQYRYDALLAELKRVGLDAEIVWDFPTPYKPFLLSSMPHEGILDSNPGCWGATIRNYEAIKIAYERGQDNVLIVEDDCRFLLDFDAVVRGLLSAPSDWDILLLDHFDVTGHQDAPVNGWARTRVSRSTACYMLRRKAMERLIKLYESPVNGKYSDPLMRICDHWFDLRYLGSDVAMYNAVPNLAIQRDCGDTSNCGHNELGLYTRIGLDLSKYADSGIRESTVTDVPQPIATTGTGEVVSSDKLVSSAGGGVVGKATRAGAADTVKPKTVDSGMWDRFDAIAVLCSTCYMHRQAGLRAELERVGLLDRVEWFWDFDNPFMVRLANSIRLAHDIRNIGGFRLTMNHYRALKTLLELGHKHVLVLEDDVRFLKDTSALASALSSMPTDYDIAKLEWDAHPARGAGPIPQITGPWYPLSGFDSYCAAAVAYSDRGMRWRVDRIEEAADYSKLFAELHIVDVYDSSQSLSRLKAYVAEPLAAVQRFTGDGVHNNGVDKYRVLYGNHLAIGGITAYAV